MGALEALKALDSRLGNRVRLAKYLLRDSFCGCAEMILIRDIRIDRLMRHAIHQEGLSVHLQECWEGPMKWTAEDILRQNIREQVDGWAQLPMHFFQEDGNDGLPTARVLVEGVVMGGWNPLMKCRNDRVVGLCLEQIFLFEQPDYRKKLEAVRDREELRSLIREVQTSVWPKYGFHINDPSDVKKHFEQQMRIQALIQSIGFVDHCKKIGDHLQAMSGGDMMKSLPPRLSKA
eukprot:gnl/TRDRNA2_/TRDRNA2_163054_c0_seq1.p1 gnl/TRDRNA2_/TRDRNA2_163054_c0~~gnl/TRDRNA2_/TRDRNA2_163054_c0_seq1.p1  ORF type:complete len:247 (+),score=35.52 gnl/TRDRNA2_/TRDRNA2_163054_c0_seq1:44-742(+)